MKYTGTVSAAWAFRLGILLAAAEVGSLVDLLILTNGVTDQALAS
jgi:hypothetical protein